MKYLLWIVLMLSWNFLQAQEAGAPRGKAATGSTVDLEAQERLRNFSERMIEELQTVTVMETESPEYAKQPGFIMPGYRRLRFYMQEDEVRKVLQEDGYVPTGKTILDSPVSLYYRHNRGGAFTFFRGSSGRYFCFDYTKSKVDLYWSSEDRLYFLDRDNDPYFKVLRTEQGEGKKDEHWRHSFLLAETIQGYRLVGISLNYAPTDHKVFDFVTNFQNAKDERVLCYLPRRYGERILVAMDKMYGTPLHKSYAAADRFSENILRTYEKFYKWDVDLQVEGEGRMFSQGQDTVQVTVSFTRFAGRVVDFQITYLLPTILDKMVPRFSSRPPAADNERPLYPPVPQLR